MMSNIISTFIHTSKLRLAEQLKTVSSYSEQELAMNTPDVSVDLLQNIFYEGVNTSLDPRVLLQATAVIVGEALVYHFKAGWVVLEVRNIIPFGITHELLPAVIDFEEIEITGKCLGVDLDHRLDEPPDVAERLYLSYEVVGELIRSRKGGR